MRFSTAAAPMETAAAAAGPCLAASMQVRARLDLAVHCDLEPARSAGWCLSARCLKPVRVQLELAEGGCCEQGDAWQTIAIPAFKAC